MGNTTRRVLGVLTLGGSFMGFTITLAQMISSPSALLNMLFSSVFALLYAWGTWCGLGLLEGSVGALKASRVYWALQMPALITPGIAYVFSAGAFLIVGVNVSTRSWFLDWRLGSQFKYAFLAGSGPVLAGVNLFAVGVVLYLSYRLHLMQPGLHGPADPVPAPAQGA